MRTTNPTHQRTKRVPIDSASNAPSKSTQTNKPRARRDAQEVKRRILAVALERFSAAGFEAVSTRSIAKAAGVVHSHLLYHFESKEKLWVATMEAAVGTYVETVHPVLDCSDTRPADVRLREFVGRFVRFAAESHQVQRIMTMESTQESYRLTQLIDHYLGDHYRGVYALIVAGQAMGAVRGGDPARIYYDIIALGSTVFMLAGEFGLITGRDVFASVEIDHTIESVERMLFI